MKSQYSDEIINAFVDGELEGIEKNKFMDAMAVDDDLSRHVMAICQLKKDIKRGYVDVSMQGEFQERQSSLHGKWKYSVAAALMLCLGGIIGWSAGYHNKAQSISPNQLPLEGVQLTSVNLQQSNKIVLHLGSSQNDKLQNTLEKLEYIIGQYQENSLPFEVEVIANAGGIDLLREDVSPYRAKVAEIAQAHSNVSFIACSNALDRLKQQGIEPRLISHVKTGSTAIDQIIKRLQQGWVYVRV